MNRLLALVALASVSVSAVTAQPTAPGSDWERVILGTADVHNVQALPGGVVLAASRGGLRRSADGGATWTPWYIGGNVAAVASVPGRVLFVGSDRYRTMGGAPVATGTLAAWRDLDGGGIASLAFASDTDPGSRTVGVVAAPDGQGWAAVGNDIWHYPGSGSQWTRTELPVDAVLAVHRGPAGRLWAGTTDGLFTADGDGGAWTPSGIAGLAITAVTEGASGAVWAGTAGGAVYRRTPPGATWTRTDVASSAVLALLALEGQGPAAVLAGTAGEGLRRSGDGGATWAPVGVDGTVPSLSASADGGNVWAAVAGDGLRRSPDGGRTWVVVRWSDAHPVHVEATVPSAGGLVVAGDAGPYGLFVYARSTGSWRSVGLGQDAEHPFRTVDDVAAAPDGRLYAAVTDVDVVADAVAVDGRPAAGAARRILGRRSVVYRSADGGASWTPAHAFPARAPYPYEGPVTALVAGPGGLLLAGTERAGEPGGAGTAALYRSGDGGTTWEQVAALDAGRVTALATGPGGTAYAGVGYEAPDVYRSVDGGRSWAPLGPVAISRPGEGLQQVMSLAVTEGGAVVAGLNARGAFRSGDGGATWLPVLEQGYASGLAPYGAAGLLAAGGDDVYRSNDGGRAWSPTGLRLPYLNDVAVGADGAAYAALESGLYRTAGSVVAAEPGAASGLGLALVAYPNPSSGRATAALDVAMPGPVVVTVSDALGRRVAVLHDGPLGAGPHEFALDASRLAPGVYVVRATAGSQDATVRLVVAR